LGFALTLAIWIVVIGLWGGLGWTTQRGLALPGVGVGMALCMALWLVICVSIGMVFGWNVWVGHGVLALIWVAASWAALLRPHFPPVDRSVLALLGVILALYTLPALVLPVPLDTDAQGFGYLALMARLSGELTVLAPFQPDVSYLYAPGFSVLAAYISEGFHAPLHTVQLVIGALLAVTVAWLIYDLAALFGGVRLGRAALLAALIGTGLTTATMDSHYTTLLGLVLGGGFLAFIRLYDTEGGWQTPVMAALCLAGLVLAHPDTTIIIGLGFGAWRLAMWLAIPRPEWRCWLVSVTLIPLGALALIGVWLWQVWPLLGSEIVSPFARDAAYWRMILSVPPETLYHGGVIMPFAIIGALVGLWRRDVLALLALGWLLLALDFAAFGILETLLPALVAPILRYDYPFSIAWHAPILPYALLGGMGLLWLYERLPQPLHGLVRPIYYGGLALAFVAIVLGGLFHRELLAFSKGRIGFFGAFSAHADVAAMTWIRHNSPADATLLNVPGPQEGDWVPVIAERRAVYYRPQPFFVRGTDPLADTPEQIALRAFWEDPAAPAHADLLAAYGVDYVIVPQVIGQPERFAEQFRWRRPFTDLLTMQSAVSDAPTLTLVFEQDGAQVYQVIASEDDTP
jgi:hypothetical protein